MGSYSQILIISMSVFYSQVAFSSSTEKSLSDFDESAFLANGPHQQGTVQIDRSKLQTVVTWCSPTMLEMRVYDEVNDSLPTFYRKISDKNSDHKSEKITSSDHPLQVSATVFPPKLPFKFANNYSDPGYVTSVCNPSSIHTSLVSGGTGSSILQYDLNRSFTVDGKKMAVATVNCMAKKSGYYETGEYTGAAYGPVGGVALLPEGERLTVTASCDTDGFTMSIK
ncbi:MAG: hypothetical protein CL816_01250 [Coxiellaceae bacterium]|nr:hypothetical protein [Coxiellaceae bacterium]